MAKLYRYNRLMNHATAARLTELNRDFYTRFGDSFSATRHRIQPGVKRVIEMLQGDEDILDLGCGNGWFALALADRGHRGSYLGLDFSLPLLRDAESIPKTFSAAFMQVDLTSENLISVIAKSGALRAATKQPQTREEIASSGYRTPRNDGFDIVSSFATLHHIPSRELRLNILNAVHQILKPNGLFIHSNWQFLNSAKLKSRIQDWSKVGLSPDDVDSNDYLLDWRSGGEGLRYVHYFDESELSDLAETTGFKIKDIFYSDGEMGNLGLYEVWKKF